MAETTKNKKSTPCRRKSSLTGKWLIVPNDCDIVALNLKFNDTDFNSIGNLSSIKFRCFRIKTADPFKR